MKTIKLYIAALMLMIASTLNAQPMNYDAMRNNARFLTDRMAYTLGITSAAIIDDIYRINFDYICGVNDYLDDIAYGRHVDYYDEICYERDRALQYLLGDYMWNRIISYDYFYRPISFANRRWSFIIYSHDMRINYYYCHTPTYYHNHYSGGHFFNGMRYRIENHRRTMNTVDKRNHSGGQREINVGSRDIRTNIQRGDNYNNNRRENNNIINRRDNNNSENNRRENRENNVINRENNNSDINVNRNNGTEGASGEKLNTSENRINIERGNINRSSNDRTDRSYRNYDRSNNNVRSSSRNFSGSTTNAPSTNTSERPTISHDNNRSTRSNVGSETRSSSMRSSGSSSSGRGNTPNMRTNRSNNGGGRRR